MVTKSLEALIVNMFLMACTSTFLLAINVNSTDPQ